MKRKVKKILVSALAASAILANSYTVLASSITVNMPLEIHSTSNQEYLAAGVKYENIRKFTALGWWNINVIRLDLENEYTELKGLFNKEGLPKRDTVSNMVNKHGAVAGINGDFFNYNPLPSALGGLISDGEIIISPIEIDYALPSFYLTHDNEGGVGYLDRKIIVTNLDKGKEITINTLNKVTTEFDTLGILDSRWGEKSIGNRFHNDLIEVVVEDDVVKDVRIGQAATNIPKNGYIILGRGSRAQVLKQLEVGDRLKLEVGTVPNVDKIKFAIGGGSIILKDGEVTSTNINIKGNHPRTGIGVNKDNTELILVTIDGRDSSFKGVSQEMFGAIMKELGAYHAINLDGGGSTTMAIKPLDQDKAKVVNKPSDGSERYVVNGVGVFTNAPRGDLSYLKLTTEDSKMFVNTSRKIVVRGYDENHYPVELDPTQLTFSVEGVEGSFEGNSFKATSSGKAKIAAEYNGIKTSLELTVLASPKVISPSTNEIRLDPNSKYSLPTFKGKDANGTVATIYKEDIDFQVLGDIGRVEDGIFYSGEHSGAGAITARVGDAVGNILVKVGSQAKLVDTIEDINRYKFLPYPETVTGSISLSPEAKVGNHSLSLKYDFSQGQGTRAAYLVLNPDSGMKLEGKPRKLGLWVKGDKSGSWLRAMATDRSGKIHYLDLAMKIDWDGWKYVEASIPSDFAYPLNLKRIYVVETNSANKQAGEILIDGLDAYYPPEMVDVDLPAATQLKDELNKKSDLVSEKSYTVTVGMDPANLEKVMGSGAIKTINAKMNESIIGVSINKISDKFRANVRNLAFIDGSTGYLRNKRYDTFFISLDSSKGGIRATNAEQWVKLKADLENRNETNLVIFLPTAVFGSNGFSDKLEAELFHDLLVKAREKGKNILVVQGGNATTAELRDGIRYIQLNTKEVKSAEDAKSIYLLRLYVNDDKISYDFIKAFE